MKLEHSFTVAADLDTVWAAVLDPERVAPCMPGASLSEVDGDTFAGTVKVKVGPISLQYKGKGEFLEKDEAARRVVIKAAGKDVRGNGTASATVTLTLRAEGDSTAGTVDTDLSITGKPAQFGRGLISEVGGKILDSFATCLAAKLAPEEEPAAPAGDQPKLAAVPPAVKDEGDKDKADKDKDKDKGDKDKVRKPKLAAVVEPESDPIDLLSYAGPSVLKRVVPLAVAALAVVLVLARRRRRR
ncbi:carbon monoxide dehydrogenase [Actinophytocola xinjiangensis]|uniref:Carbon monoxide dehydrogenase n=1 Tax=Actinophytocola xinjiangensis TaxID=485602 RepID=A0A7Z1AXL9_9PSEU|nr:SRPBCC family protein [Actinophytocola xinjiangensis]OLF09361.1 carbon monoxide dehydrogenase [Actinophytocola xinjiangensis]